MHGDPRFSLRECMRPHLGHPIRIGLRPEHLKGPQEQDQKVFHYWLVFIKVTLIKPMTTSRAIVRTTSRSSVLCASNAMPSTVAAPPSIAIFVSPLIEV